MMPVINNSNETNSENPETIRVGNLGTNPVSKYSIKTGIPSIRDDTKNMTLMILKNAAGLYSLNRIVIVFKTLRPSE